MEIKKIDITSSVVEKTIDLAKGFLDKLIIPPVEETGLLLKEQVTFWKFKNQVRVLNKAKEYCEKHNIDPKTISLKLLCPLLDYSALEEDEKLQSNWAILLGNMVDSSQNIQNHVFPYILSQISSDEFELLREAYQSKLQRQARVSAELESYKREKAPEVKELEAHLLIAKTKVKKNQEELPKPDPWKGWEVREEIRGYERKLHDIDIKEKVLVAKFNEQEEVEALKDFELSNLMRLGLIKYVQTPYADSQTLEIPYDVEERSSGYLKVDLDVDIDFNEKHVMTELGELFITACTDKVANESKK